MKKLLFILNFLCVYHGLIYAGHFLRNNNDADSNDAKRNEELTSQRIAGYYIRNIDDIPLIVKLSSDNDRRELKSIIFKSNEEIFVEMDYLKRNDINHIFLAVYCYGKELYKVCIPSPIKKFKHEKVYNFLRLTNGFYSKHVQSQDKEYVLTYRVEGVDYEGFYKRTKLYQPRTKSRSFTQLMEGINRPLYAYQLESK